MEVALWFGGVLTGFCFHPWCPDGRASSRVAGKSLSRLYLRNRKV